VAGFVVGRMTFLTTRTFPAPLRQHFGRVDTNNDGYVCKEELTKVADRLRAAVQGKKTD